jgi:hypothetical protein
MIRVLALALLLTGCSTVEQYAEKGVDAAKVAHDKQIIAGETLLCGSSLRAFLDRYAGDPVKFQSAITLCGYDRYFDLMGGLK